MDELTSNEQNQLLILSKSKIRSPCSQNSSLNAADEDSEYSDSEVQEAEEKALLDFSYLFEENQEGLDGALEMLNFEASEIGFKFKRGPFLNLMKIHIFGSIVM